MIKNVPVLRSFLLRQHTRRLSRALEKDEVEGALSDVIEIVTRDPAMERILKQFAAGPADIRELYRFLIEGGADCWIHGNYIAAIGITNPIIVYAYLRDRHRRREQGFCMGFTDTCIRYIEGGYTESFLYGMLKVPKNFGMMAL